ncbi:hypothetical protein V5N11_000471 [Cardamine amara subsp. amara]|uniref:Uncharacterized protein n=1 Tax=Cardamine amara subsp. amara TaxID=228776 RepID=A0ABD0ZZQ7_CARAN
MVTSNRLGLNGGSIFQGLIERARRTVHGSADDIGWLQRDPEINVACLTSLDLPNILFNILFLSVFFISRHGVHTFPISVVYLLVPGLFSNHGIYIL